MSKNDRMVGISRRTLVKSTAIGSLALAAGGFSLPFTLRSAAATVQQASEKVIWGACSVNCGCNFAFFSGLIGAQFWAERAQPKSPELDAKLLASC